jgi:cupin fold WbuC family metalloprotein
MDTIDDLMSFLLESASSAPLRRSRICLHKDGNSVSQLMVILVMRDSFIPLHKHRLVMECYFPLAGSADLLFFDDSGCLINNRKMGATSDEQKSSLLSVSPGIVHTISVESDYFMYLEFKECRNLNNDEVINCSLNQIASASLLRSTAEGKYL